MVTVGQAVENGGFGLWVGALLLLALMATDSEANVITFETLPDGSTPTDNQELTTSYSTGGTITTFGFDTDDDLVIDRHARLERRGGGDSISGYLATDSDDADQSASSVGGDWMLREPGGVGNSGAEAPIINMGAGGDDFLIHYSGTLSNSAAGQIWDWDNNERWLITAFDISNTLISEIDTGINTDPNRGGAYDGRPLEFAFSSLSSDIALIRISFTGTAANAGFAFDNFSATTSSTAIPAAASMMLMLSGLVSLGRRGSRLGAV